MAFWHLFSYKLRLPHAWSNTVTVNLHDVNQSQNSCFQIRLNSRNQHFFTNGVWVSDLAALLRRLGTWIKVIEVLFLKIAGQREANWLVRFGWARRRRVKCTIWIAMWRRSSARILRSWNCMTSIDLHPWVISWSSKKSCRALNWVSISSKRRISRCTRSTGRKSASRLSVSLMAKAMTCGG